MQLRACAPSSILLTELTRGTDRDTRKPRTSSRAAPRGAAPDMMNLREERSKLRTAGDFAMATSTGGAT